MLDTLNFLSTVKSWSIVTGSEIRRFRPFVLVNLLSEMQMFRFVMIFQMRNFNAPVMTVTFPIRVRKHATHFQMVKTMYVYSVLI